MRSTELGGPIASREDVSRCATMKLRNAISDGSLRLVITALPQSRQPQNGTGQGCPLSPNGLA